ncbi:MAG TPA: transcription-repair coupling factor, partial [Steroidobacteraceae bacterium]|nr:transcription-repair coupling factor [Steroidobacteraceae bacterium]
MNRLLDPPRPDTRQPRLQWQAVHGSARALAIAEAAAADRRLYVVVTADARALDELERELRFFADAKLAILQLPDWEVLPYDLFSPHADIVSERLATLANLPQVTQGILLLAAETLLQRLPPRQFIHGRTFNLKTGQKFALAQVREQLTQAGYYSVAQVSTPGEYALRGSLFDVFPMGASSPLRIDLFDEEIDSIRRFDPESQRSLDKIDAVRLLPAREVPLDEESVRSFRRRFRTRFEGDPTRSSVYRGVTSGLAPPGVEFYLPLFFEQTADLFDYLPPAAVLLADEAISAELAGIWSSIEARYEDRRHDIERPLLEPAEIFLTPEQVLGHLGAMQAIDISESSRPAVATSPGADLQTMSPPTLRLDSRAAEPMAPLLDFLDSFPGRVLIGADSPGRREVLQEMLRAQGRTAQQLGGWQEFCDRSDRLSLVVAPDVGGLALLNPPLVFLADSQLFGQRARQERRRRRAALDPEAILRDLQDLAAGAPVVHEEYGVGRYVGLEVMDIADQRGEFLIIEYQGGDRIYVPVSALHLVSRYTGAAPESAPLHKLGTDQWARARKRATDKIRDVAAELLDLYARRQARKGLALPLQEAEYRSFAAAFPFEETPDQAEAIDRVIADLASERPMDRIICGDVGFGKTEVAMRAAFVAVQAGRQVAVLVPTTLLAEQHVTTFRDRFADYPVRIEALSRFRAGKEANAVLQGLADGKVDIVIATHRLLHADARFKDLGLLIVDEEHRFGVRDKERLKALRAEVHVLTLTATPIPRTLNMALGGLRELSLITTPPPARIAIKTFVTEWDAHSIREAAMRELRRGGQIYFVHNEVSSIDKLGADLAALIPEAKLRIGHGQMRERDLEQLMVDFYHRRFNLLLCTTIIESGIDVPTANTIMINRADRLGLAQLHQLRGRVGRSHHRAYAYLIVPSRRALTPDAARRLEAIESLEELGAGFVLATHDLEIRGAGEFLGESQSGELTEVGLTLYLDMLERAVAALKDGREPDVSRPLAAATEVNLHMPAMLPEDFVGDVHMRLNLYKRIAAAATLTALDDLQAELVDRFGELPPAAANLVRTARLTQMARQLGIRRIDVSTQSSYLVFEAENRIDPQ